MIEKVLDASAVLAYLYSESGAEVVENLLENSIISRINVTEILTKLVFDGLTIEEAKKTFDKLTLEIAEFNETQFLKAAELRIQTKQFGLSLGDRCCLALAIEKNLPAVTADKTWGNLSFCKTQIIR